MSSLSALLRFCDFLENRVRTGGLPLLRRMLEDFSAGNEHTLQDFVRLGASVVVVYPIEVKSQRRLQDAAIALAHQRNEFAVASTERPHDSQPPVFQYLMTRVASKNLSWLGEMFQQFCRGVETLLQEFIRRGDEVISLIPTDARQTPTFMMAMPWSTGFPTPFPQLPSVSVLSKRARNLERVQHYLEGRPEEVGARAVKRPRLESNRDALEQESESSSSDEELEPAPQAPNVSLTNDLLAAINRKLERVEAKEPWKRVFEPNTLPVPFSGKHKKLAAAWRNFWAGNARAVWERRFWAPLSEAKDLPRWYARKCRQQKARRAFDSLMLEIHQELGPTFFVKLDQRTSRHSGWWYGGPQLNLLGIAKSSRLSKCLRYIESQKLQRFPALTGSGRRSQNRESVSMWSSSTRTKPILTEIRALKTARSKSKK